MTQLVVPDICHHAQNKEQESNLTKPMEELIFQANITSLGDHSCESCQQRDIRCSNPLHISSTDIALPTYENWSIKKTKSTSAGTEIDPMFESYEYLHVDNRSKPFLRICTNETEGIVVDVESSACHFEPAEGSCAVNVQDEEDSLLNPPCTLGGLPRNSSVMSTSSAYSESESEIQCCLKWWQKAAIRKAAVSLENELAVVVSNSAILRKRKNVESCYDIPLFNRSEIITGPLLGRGSFSDVREIVGCNLDECFGGKLSKQQQQLRIDASSNAIDRNTGRGRWAIKYLKESLVSNEKINQFEVAALDLIVEGEYLLAIQHPNIIAIRGAPIDGVKAFAAGRYDSYFIIFDRLDQTLDDRIHTTWKSGQIVSPDVYQKTQLALQIADALQYLHQNRIMFRDLKPQNIGFSIDDQDQVMLFDFGLCRELPAGSSNGAMNDVYEMSGVGTLRYIAPETVLTSQYNLKADVYSWSVVFWEILAECRPYEDHSAKHHQLSVCEGGERPSLDKLNWPTTIQFILAQSWHADHFCRMSILDVCQQIRTFLSQHQGATNPIQSLVTTRESTSVNQKASKSLHNVISNDDQLLASGLSVLATQRLSECREAPDTTSNSTFNYRGEEKSNVPYSRQSDDEWLQYPIKYTDLTFDYDYGVEVITYFQQPQLR